VCGLTKKGLVFNSQFEVWGKIGRGICGRGGIKRGMDMRYEGRGKKNEGERGRTRGRIG
jgi:hypothetical protein